VADFFTGPEAAAWGGFISLSSKLSKRLEENLRRSAGLSHAEYEVLLRLVRSDDGRLRMQALAADSVLSHSGTSRLVDRLEGAGFVERADAEEDKRGAYVVLTGTGREHFMTAAADHTALVHKLFLDHFTKEELSTMASLWTRIEDAPSEREA